jgi:hypothetical protein
VVERDDLAVAHLVDLADGVHLEGVVGVIGRLPRRRRGSVRKDAASEKASSAERRGRVDPQHSAERARATIAAISIRTVTIRPTEIDSGIAPGGISEVETTTTARRRRRPRSA